MLTQKEFDFLIEAIENGGNCPKEGDCQELTRRGLIKSGSITPAAFEALAPYKVRRAIFLAAGKGNRLMPITINTPKPLVRVNGVRMIDTLLDAVVEAGIEEIIIVRGYLSAQFEELREKYKGIRFIDNHKFDSENNISSAILVKDYLENAYILEADLVLKNQKLIKSYQYRSNYLGVYTKKTDDFCFETENGRITKLKRGGEHCHHMFGISYWSIEDGKKLRADLERMYSSGGTQRYWDDAALVDNIEGYSIFVRECSFSDIVEIDSFKELTCIDSSYKTEGRA